MRTIYYILFICCIAALYSCMKDAPEDFSNPESSWNPNFSFPVGYTSLGMNEESGFDTLLLLINPLTGDPYWVDFDIELSFILPFDMQEIDRFSEEIISLLFRLNIYNGFPGDARGQMYFLDIDSTIIETMFAGGPLTMEAGTLAGDGETVNTTHTQTNVVFDQSKVQALSNARYILVEGTLSNINLDSTLFDYYPGYKLDIQLGIQAELNMSLAPK